MKYPVYPQYKDSGVAWLGEVPGHWESISLKWVSRLYAGGTPDKSNDSYWEDGHIPWLNSGSVNYGYITQPSELITLEGFLNSSAKWIPEKSLVIALAGQGKTKGMVAQLGIRATCNQSMAAIIPCSKVYPRYLYWWLTSNYQNIRNMAGGEQRDGLNLVMIGSIPCPLFPVLEQTAIADFLDQETRRIDTLVAKKRKLVELLKEKRSALISRTVTRGLPDAAAREFDVPVHNDFKSSGIEWLGDVPIEWGKARKLTHFASNEKNSFVNGPFGSDLLSSEITDQGVPVIYIRDISSGKYRRKSQGCVTEEKANQLKFCNVLPGDILIAKVGDPPGTAVVYPDNEPNAIVTQDVIRLRVDSRKVCAIYLAYFLNSSAGKGLIDQVAIDSTRMRVGLGDYKGSLAIFPPIKEQSAISIYLDRETAKIDRLVEKVETAINRLQEYRSALITAAVTGKIDVREYV